MLVIPVYDNLVLPGMTIFLPVETVKNAAGRDAVMGDRVALLVLKQKTEKKDMTKDSFRPIGASGYVVNSGDNGFVGISIDGRLNIDDIQVRGDGTLAVSTSKRPDTDFLTPGDKEKSVQNIKNKLAGFLEGQPWAQAAKVYLNQWTSLEQILGALSGWLVLSPEEKYAMLAEDSAIKRNQMMEKSVLEFMEMSKLTGEANSKREQDYQKIYREDAIKKQMEYLQKQLDDMHPENVTDLQKMEKKLKESGMNEDAMKECTQVLSRLKQEGPNSPDYGMLYEYLNFMTSLSWKKAEPQKIDLSEAEAILNEDHYGLKKVKQRVLQQIAVMDLTKKQSGTILLFVGAPGTGKTSIGQSIARALHRKYVRVSLGGIRDEADIRGHRRTYIGAMPGRIMDAVKKSGVSNPVMVLDEVDKLGVSYNGDPASALLEVLDPEQNNTFTDHYLNVPYDLSDVVFICTANSADTIPEPLLNRMEVIQFSGYDPKEKFEIAKRHLLPKAMKSVGIDASTLEVTDDAITKIIDGYTMEAGVRGLKRQLDTLCRIAAVEIVKNGRKKVTVSAENLAKYLDENPIHHEHILEKKQPGVVTGMAWTPVGGEILFIETLFTKGTGRVILTGQLGDVMKESAQIAISVVKSMYPEKAELFEKNDLHIHVPEGAIKKDGPSAGITLTTALASLVTGIPVDPTIAMTGEVSLRGVVMPIGGLPEKLMAAERAGIKTVLIPTENMDDLKDVNEIVRSDLNIIPVSTVQEALEETGIRPRKQAPASFMVGM